MQYDVLQNGHEMIYVPRF